MDQTTIEEALKALHNELDTWLTPIQARIDQVSAKLDQAAAARWDVRILDTSDERVIDLVMRLLALRFNKSRLLATLPKPLLRSSIVHLLEGKMSRADVLRLLYEAGEPIDQNTFYRFANGVKLAYEYALKLVLIGSTGEPMPAVGDSGQPQSWGRSIAAQVAQRLAASGSCKLARILPNDVLVETVEQLMLKRSPSVKTRKWLAEKIAQNVHPKQMYDLWSNVHAALKDLGQASAATGDSQ